jgi:hypothetical protein
MRDFSPTKYNKLIAERGSNELPPTQSSTEKIFGPLKQVKIFFQSIMNKVGGKPMPMTNSMQNCDEARRNKTRHVVVPGKNDDGCCQNNLPIKKGNSSIQMRNDPHHYCWSNVCVQTRTTNKK